MCYPFHKNKNFIKLLEKYWAAEQWRTYEPTYFVLQKPTNYPKIETFLCVISDLRPGVSEILRGLDFYLVMDVSGQPVASFRKGHFQSTQRNI
jgi:hypothetical protein